MVFIKGELNLITVRYINCESRIEMEAIAALCPFLKEVHFYRGQSSSLFLEELRSLLSSPGSCWSKVHS